MRKSCFIAVQMMFLFKISNPSWYYLWWEYSFSPKLTIHLQSNFMNQTHYNAKNDGILAERYWNHESWRLGKATVGAIEKDNWSSRKFSFLQQDFQRKRHYGRQYTIIGRLAKDTFYDERRPSQQLSVWYGSYSYQRLCPYPFIERHDRKPHGRVAFGQRPGPMG